MRLGQRPGCHSGRLKLTTAAEELESIGATWDVARVRAELRAHRSTEWRRPGRTSNGNRLSPREQEVAALADADLSNREIAATLYLSPRTVEQHVPGSAEGGALSRRDLARMVRTGKPEG
ncbi:LuxR C-terminal-related transcriptional regulator [Streptomyces sp. NBC_00322]|uniref:LuxR family transcriptional regulator n=1 Tax=Streptomyces sp. NBC_00322 TaxID=2975712 RepID=UPI003FA797C3